MKNIYITLITVLLLFFYSKSEAGILIQTTDVVYTPGTEFTIPIIIYGASEDGSPISGANIVFTFDTAAVQFMQFTNFNPLMPQSQWVFSGNNNTGLVSANWLEPNYLTVALPDSSALYYVKFKAKPGACDFVFTNLEFLDAGFNILPSSGDNGSYASLQQLTFQVNMRDQSVSPDGVHLAGTFNNWSTTATPMTAGDSTIYFVTLQLVSDNLYYFRYVNGNTTAGYETVPVECGVPSGNDYNRTVTIPDADSTLDAVCFSSCDPCLPQAQVTFLVNMRDQDISSGGVHLAGSFNNWSTTATEMTLSYEAVYTATLTLVTENTYTYKFVNGNTTAGYETVPAECGVPFGNDYARSVTGPETDLTLPDVCFASCDTCPPLAEVTFRVDMSEQNISANGVHIAGNFNNWSPSATLMNNLGNDIFGVTIPLIVGSDVEYRFVNGNTSSGFEIVPSYCGVPAGGGLYNRFLPVPESDSTLMAVCFSNCSECLSLRSVTFKVDMGEQDISPDGVHLAGSFNGFSPNATSMTNQGNDVFIATIDILEEEDVTYRFVNGDDASGFEIVPPGCGQDNGSGIFNRYLTVPQQDTILTEVCFSSCEDCEQQAWEKDITFQVDMSKEDISENGIQLAGTFNGWDPSANTMLHVGNNIYSITLTLNENDAHQYRFVNGNTTAGYENVPEECGVTGASGGLERQITIPSQDITLPAVCFAACEPCLIYQVTFQVDMMRETISVFGIHLAGSFNSWDPGSDEMLSTGSTVYETTIPVYQGDTLKYRFVNGNQSTDMETVPSDCGWLYNGTDYSRFILPVSDTLVELVCFSWCDPCDVGIEEGGQMLRIGTIYPNPAYSYIKIPVFTPEPARVLISLKDMLGNDTENAEFSLTGGSYELSLPIHSMPEGLYFINIKAEGQSSSIQATQKLIITK